MHHAEIEAPDACARGLHGDVLKNLKNCRRKEDNNFLAWNVNALGSLQGGRVVVEEELTNSFIPAFRVHVPSPKRCIADNKAWITKLRMCFTG